ncbi:3-oxoadipate enol-lactonase [Natronohydrobacter thiooxidans]|uniref:3-oxoadipate enol-lactonase n=1 Tax=Natronohydrobacter thiooxidans TaxID=87172 RepID=UPI0008FF520C|nr:3-oxoadipate enol-lactonase [Natronohydrobacter thiooxidans]
MQAIRVNDVTLHVVAEGPPDAPAVLFANSLGTDLRLWDAVLPYLPTGLRYVRYDKRGHGLSECPAGGWTIADLAQDAEALIEALDLGPVLFVGLSIGGMIGQQLAATRPDLVRALVLSNTAARMGTPEMWATRIAAIRAQDLQAMESTILDRWFGPAFRHGAEATLWGAMLSRTPQAGYLSCCAAIAQADLTEQTARLNLPVLAIAGEMDGASPPELVADTARRIPGSQCHVIPGTGHLPCVEDPRAYAAILSPFLKEHSNV